MSNGKGNSLKKMTWKLELTCKLVVGKWSLDNLEVTWKLEVSNEFRIGSGLKMGSGFKMESGLKMWKWNEYWKWIEDAKWIEDGKQLQNEKQFAMGVKCFEDKKRFEYRRGMRRVATWTFEGTRWESENVLLENGKWCSEMLNDCMWFEHRQWLLDKGSDLRMVNYLNMWGDLEMGSDLKIRSYSETLSDLRVGRRWEVNISKWLDEILEDEE